MNPITVTVTGRLGDDPRVFTTRDGTLGIELRLAVDLPARGSGDGITRWVKVTAYGLLAERTAESIGKGDRVTPSPLPRAGRSAAIRSSTPRVPSRVVKTRGSSPSRPVTVTVIGFMVSLQGCGGRGGPAALVAAWDWGSFPAGQSSALRRPGPARPAGAGGQDLFPAGKGKGAPAKPAPGRCPRRVEKISARPQRAQREAGCGTQRRSAS